MNLIIIDKQTGKSRTIPLRTTLIYLSLLLLVVVGFAVGWSLNAWLAPHDTSATARSLVQDIRDDLNLDLTRVQIVKAQADERMQSLTMSLAEMQAKLVRLDALGERLLEKANLTDGEFDFSGVPPMGGPRAEQGEDVSHQLDVLAELDQLIQDVLYREEQLEVLESLLDTLKFKSDGYLSGRPIRSGWMSSRYGRRTDPFTGKSAWHGGVDFAGKDGSDVIAVGSGVVTWSGRRGGYGLLVEINHGQGYSTRYAHAREVLVNVGDVVSKGQTVAKMGSTGRSTGPHVHFEVIKNGKPVDPTRYVNRRALE